MKKRLTKTKATNLFTRFSRLEKNLVVELLDEGLVLVVLNEVLRTLQYQPQASLKIGGSAKEVGNLKLI